MQLFHSIDGMNELKRTTLGMVTLTDTKDNVMFNYTDSFSANFIGVWPGVSNFSVNTLIQIYIIIDIISYKF